MKLRVAAALLVLISLLVAIQLADSRLATAQQPGGPTSSVSTGSTQHSLIQVEPIGPLRLSSDKPSVWTYVVPIAASFLSAFLAFLGATFGLRVTQRNTEKTVEAGQRTTEATLWQKANEVELRAIQERLDKFYGPLSILLKTDDQFAQDIRSRQPEGYRLLVKLFDPLWVQSLSPGDQKLVELICERGVVLEQFIHDNAAGVDKELVPYLSRATAHFRILYLAYKHELGTDWERFKDYAYPRQLDKVLEIARERLVARMQHLRANPGVAPGMMPPLVIPPELSLDPWPDPDKK